MSKAALAYLTRILDVELRPHRIRVNAVAPQLIDTSANRAWVPADMLAHAVSPEAIAAVIAFDATTIAAWHAARCTVGSASSAVRRGRLSSVVWLAVISEGDLNGPFVGAADDVELDGAARCGLECVEQVVGGGYRVTRGGHDQVALGETCAGGRAVLHHVADEQAIGVGQPDGAAEPPGHVVRRDGNAEPRRLC